MKIAIAVHGRFHAFELARALRRAGHQVTVFTTYPRRVVGRWGLPREIVRSAPPWHGVLFRYAPRLGSEGLERFSHRLFARWTTRKLRKETWDAVHLWSGVAEEPLMRLEGKAKIRTLMRGSSHIRNQARLLNEEEKRSGASLHKPGPWRISQEEREYDMADLIVCLSEFAYQTFIEAGIPQSKLCKVPLGVREESFKPVAGAISDRIERIRSGRPIRVIYVGTISFHKGLFDLAAAVHQLPSDKFIFRLVGGVAPDARSAVDDLSAKIELYPRQPEHRLPEHYAWADVFLFPTIEDGFAAVLMQAQGSGLPLIASANSGAPDIVEEGRNGWLISAGDTEAFIQRLRWCDGNRPELAQMISEVGQARPLRVWDDVARDFAKCLKDALSKANRSE